MEMLQHAGPVQAGKSTAAYFTHRALPRTSQGHTCTARHCSFAAEILSCSLQIYCRYTCSKLHMQKGLGVKVLQSCTIFKRS